jgi:hypothetical protein
VRLSPLGALAINWPIVTAPDERWWMWSSLWNENLQGKLKYSENTCPNATLSTTNPTWPDPGSNPGRRGGKLATNRLSYGMALWESKWQKVGENCIMRSLYLSSGMNKAISWGKLGWARFVARRVARDVNIKMYLKCGVRMRTESVWARIRSNGSSLRTRLEFWAPKWPGISLKWIALCHVCLSLSAAHFPSDMPYRSYWWCISVN